MCERLSHTSSGRRHLKRVVVMNWSSGRVRQIVRIRINHTCSLVFSSKHGASRKYWIESNPLVKRCYGHLLRSWCTGKHSSWYPRPILIRLRGTVRTYNDRAYMHFILVTMLVATSCISDRTAPNGSCAACWGLLDNCRDCKCYAYCAKKPLRLDRCVFKRRWSLPWQCLRSDLLEPFKRF